MSTQNEQTKQQQQEMTTMPPAEDSQAVADQTQQADAFDPENLTEDDLLNYFKWRRFDFEDFNHLLMKIDEFLQDYSNDQFWKALSTARECLTMTHFYATENPDDAIICKVDSDLLNLFNLLQFERAKRLKRGESEVVFPRSENSLDDAKEMLEGCKDMNPNMFLYHIAASVRHVQRGEIEKGFQLATLLVHFLQSLLQVLKDTEHDFQECITDSRETEQSPVKFIEYIFDDEDDETLLDTYNHVLSHHTSLVVRAFEQTHFKLIRFIIDHEGEDILCESDSVLKTIMVEKGLMEHFYKPMWAHARHIRKYMLKFIELGDQERAIKLCKRYLSIQKCYSSDVHLIAERALTVWHQETVGISAVVELRDFMGVCRRIMSQQQSDWLDLPAKIKMTECVLERLEQGRLQEIRDAQKIAEGSVECRTPVDSNLCAFFEDHLVGAETEDD